MSFTRTPSGLGNQCFFYGVDAVVFTEGGDLSWTFEDIRNNEFNENSVDILFWTKLFESFRSDLNLKFKAVGSKATVSAIALEIQSNNLNTVIAAMDSEFDHIHNKCIDHPNVLYTHGYSWENDVWSSSIIVSLLENVSGEKIDTDLIETCLDSFIESIEDGVYADAQLFGINDSFLPRKGHLKCVKCDVKQAPVVLKEFIDDLFTEKGLVKNDVHEFVKGLGINVLRSCYGHLLNDFIYHLVRFYSTTVLGIKTIHKELMERFAINNFLTITTEEIKSFHELKIKNTLPNIG